MAAHAFDTSMNNARPNDSWTKNGPSNRVQFDVLPPVQAGLSAALRRAFRAPVDDDCRAFDELLKRLG